MGLFDKNNKKYCPICGKPVDEPLLGRTCADGSVCIECFRKYRLVSDSDISALTIAEISDMIKTG